MDIRKIKKLIEMLQDSDLNEIEVKEGEESVRIARGASSSQQNHSSALISEWFPSALFCSFLLSLQDIAVKVINAIATIPNVDFNLLILF